MNPQVLLAYIVGRGSLEVESKPEPDLLDAVGVLVSQGYLAKKRGVFFPTSQANVVIAEELGL